MQARPHKEFNWPGPVIGVGLTIVLLAAVHVASPKAATALAALIVLTACARLAWLWVRRK